MTKDLLLEVGCEEIPAAFVPKALDILEDFVSRKFTSSRLAFSSVKTFGTPRRLSLIVEGLEAGQEDAETEVRGPKKEAAYDADGAPTRALEGFLRGQGARIEDVKFTDTGKGEQVYVTKKIKGEKTEDILPEILSGALGADLFKKTMRWGAHSVSFARPVHWLLAFYGDKQIDFEFGHIKSGNKTFGHRFLSTRSAGIEINSIDSYLAALKGSKVVLEPDERKRIIREGLKAKAEEVGGVLLADDALVEEVAYLVEYPVVVRGEFEAEFLKLPSDIIINAGREHQRYFSIVDAEGRLLPYFLTVANTEAKEMAVVVKGNERVLRARLNDAKFYFDSDIDVPLVTHAEALKGVVFQKKLGTSYEKAERFTRLALFVGATAGISAAVTDEDTSAAFLSDGANPTAYKGSDPLQSMKLIIGRAAMLAKADLTTGVVGEFPKLQGVMGGVYAARSEETLDVSRAIVEHYLPTASGGALPESIPGAIVSIADKLDTIVGCFAVGLIPTGTQDPYALRRQALGIIAILSNSDIDVPLDKMVAHAATLLTDKIEVSPVKKGDAIADDSGKNPVEEVTAKVLEFFKERLRNTLLGDGLAFDSIDSVLSAPWYDISDATRRIRAIEKFKAHPSCSDLVVAFKRVSNILKKAGSATVEPDAALFVEDEERALYEISQKVAPRIAEHSKAGDYSSLLESLASIKERTDAFFDNVMVMAEDEAVRTNRLALLGSVRSLYSSIAD
ncbi:MAG: glycine--tRNA ligase subunit beta, partial [Proteobacteria bacterium]|nr:glycine--tRNA ligase subunit beta [Pseudomonadota bacterium]